MKTLEKHLQGTQHLFGSLQVGSPLGRTRSWYYPSSLHCPPGHPPATPCWVARILQRADKGPEALEKLPEKCHQKPCQDQAVEARSTGQPVIPPRQSLDVKRLLLCFDILHSML